MILALALVTVIWLLVPVMVYFKVPVGGSLALFPIGVLELILFGTALGVLLAPMGILFKDVEIGTGMMLGFWMLLTPVVYPPMQSGWGAVVAKWNPVSPVLQTSRDWLVGQAPVQLPGFCWVTGITAVALFVGWILYRISLPHVIARIGN